MFSTIIQLVAKDTALSSSISDLEDNHAVSLCHPFQLSILSVHTKLDCNSLKKIKNKNLLDQCGCCVTKEKFSFQSWQKAGQPCPFEGKWVWDPFPLQLFPLCRNPVGLFVTNLKWGKLYRLMLHFSNRLYGSLFYICWCCLLLWLAVSFQLRLELHQSVPVGFASRKPNSNQQRPLIFYRMEWIWIAGQTIWIRCHTESCWLP